MTNREQAKMNAYTATDNFLKENKAIYSEKRIMNNETAKFHAAYANAKMLAVKTGTDNTGFSQSKKTAKEAMGKKAAILSGFALVFFSDENTGKSELATQLNISATDYTSASDEEAAKLAQAAYNLLNDNINLLSPDYVTETDLVQLQTLITTFQNTHGNSSSVHAISPIDTSNFKAALKTLDAIIAKLRLLARFAIDTHPNFYKGLIAVTTIPTVHTYHTIISGVLRCKETKQPIENASFSLSSSKKTALSDANGFYCIEEVRSGIATLSVVANGYKNLTIQIAIQRGKENVIDLQMEQL